MKFKSKVIRGSGHGSSIGYPTANLRVKQEMKDFFSQEGVWLAKVKVDNKEYRGALFWGKRSLFAEQEPVCEILLLDYRGDDLYDKPVEVEVFNFIRPTVAVKNNEELRNLIESDIKIIRDY